MRILLLMAGVVSVFAQAFGASATSATFVVWTKPDESLQWKTVMSTSAPVALCWPDGAASARLTVSWRETTLGTSTVSDTRAKTATLPLGAFPAVLEDERIVDVSIKYFDGDDNELDSASVSLGYVTGIGSSPTRLVTDTNGKPWNRVDKSAVLQIPEDTTALTVDTVSQDIGTPPGWWEWYNIAGGTHNLKLNTTLEDFEASHMRASGGLILFAR